MDAPGGGGRMARSGDPSGLLEAAPGPRASPPDPAVLGYMEPRRGFLWGSVTRRKFPEHWQAAHLAGTACGSGNNVLVGGRGGAPIRGTDLCGGDFPYPWQF